MKKIDGLGWPQLREGKYDRLRVERADGVEEIACPKIGGIPHDMVHFAVENVMQGDGFLRHMVRSIAGTLVEIGRGWRPVDSMATPIWNFHGDVDGTVPVSMSRDRMAALRKAGAHPLYTEYGGVDHNVWQWAYTEPALLPWVFSKHRRA